jgi:transcription termination factor NusA
MKEGYLSLLKIPGVGEMTASSLYEAGFTSAKDVAEATIADLLQVQGLTEKKANQIFASAQALLRGEEETPAATLPVEAENSEEEIPAATPPVEAESGEEETLAAMPPVETENGEEETPAATPPVETENQEAGPGGTVLDVDQV